MNAPDHLFSPRHNVARRAESATFWLFRAATYFILLCGAVVFLDIVVKGGRTVFQTKAPFINTTFLTAAPESLYIFEWEGRKREMGDREFRAFKETHPEAAKVGQIIAAPTLVKELPAPVRKFIGNLSQTERLLLGLEIWTKG